MNAPRRFRPSHRDPPTPARRVLALALLLALATPMAATAEEETGDTALARVEVVGSRIKRVDLETWQPVLVLERSDLERSGLMAVGEILQTLVVHGAALNPQVNNGGDGTTRIDLRNLGDQRTLVLVDGRRWITGIDGTVDLNSIPLAIVERIEVLKDGASAVYGSDAIAGVVSVTTRKDYVGRETRAYYGRYGRGDGALRALEATAGWAGDWGGLALSLSHQRQQPVFAGDRAISALPVFGLPANDVRTGASFSTPFGLFGFGSRGVCPFNPAGVYPANGVCASSDGRPPPLNRSTFDPATSSYRLFDLANDGYNFAPENYLLTPQERSALFANGQRRVGELSTLSLQLLYNERRSAQELAPNPIMTSVLLSGANRIVIPADHVHNPFGQAVNSLALRPGGQLRRFEQDADTLRVAGGYAGAFTLGDRLWSWGIDGIYGRYTIAASSRGLVDLGRLALALGPSFRDAGGVARCGTPQAVIAGCVPFDPFRGPAGLSAEMLDYVYFAGRDETRTESRQFLLHADGDLLDLPAGPMAVALGLEYRKEEGNSRLDARRIAIQNLVDNSYGGSQIVREAYLELAAPLLAGRPLAETLDLSVALRHSRYDSFGSTSNFDSGLRWQPLSSLLLRASLSEGFRAPIVSELFFPAGEGFGGLQFDPCNAVNQPNASQRANCAADGVPGGSYEQEGLLYRVLTGGNPALRPETARSRTAGLVWSPPAAPGFDLSLDWYRIHIEDAIARAFEADLLRFCANQGVPEACARTIRDARGELLAVDARLLNSGVLQVEGWDLGLNWRIDSGFGRFQLGWDSSYVVRHLRELPRGSGRRPVLGNLLPLEPGFRLRSSVNLGWERGDWSATVSARHYSGLDEACVAPGNAGRPELCTDPGVASNVSSGFPLNRLGSSTYVDLQAAWNAPFNARIVAGLRNALERDPPRSYSAFANSFDPAYPLPGRFWYLQWVQRW